MNFRVAADLSEREVDGLRALLDGVNAIRYLHVSHFALLRPQSQVAPKHVAPPPQLLHKSVCELAEIDVQDEIDTADAALIRDWLHEVMQITGLKPTPLAKEAGLAPSTLLRALDPDSPTTLERRSISRIVKAFGVPEPGEPRARSPQTMDLVAPSAEQKAPNDLAPNQYLRAAGSRVLDLAGILPGDLLRLDMGLPPQAGDIVDAQIYGPQRGAETVLRLYDPPYLVTRSSDPATPAKPLLVDGERIRIAAVVVQVVRWPRKVR